jgi:hypothetical protein
MKWSVVALTALLALTLHVVAAPLADGARGSGAAPRPAQRAQAVRYCAAPASAPIASVEQKFHIALVSRKGTKTMLTLCALFVMALIACRRLGDSGP